MQIQMKGKEAEILLYEDIGFYFGISADTFVREVQALGDLTRINLRINSNGGSVFDGISIYNYLKSHKARIEVDIDGLAASIASVVAMSGDEVRIAESAWMMIHEPAGFLFGGAAEFRKEADLLDGLRDTSIDIYMQKASVPRENISDMMAEETWLNAEDAVEYGLADASTPELKVAASVHKDWFQHVPEKLQIDTTRPTERPRAEWASRIQARQKFIMQRLKRH